MRMAWKENESDTTNLDMSLGGRCEGIDDKLDDLSQGQMSRMSCT